MPTLQERVDERRRAVAIAQHLRDSEGLSLVQIGQRLGRSPTTVKGYSYDPTGEKTRAVKQRYQGACRGCGAPTSARNGKGDAYAYCKHCHNGAIQNKWTRERVRDAMLAWRSRYGDVPTSCDWSCTHAQRRGGQAVARLADGDWPSSATVTDSFGSWTAAHAEALSGLASHRGGSGLRSSPRPAGHECNFTLDVDVPRLVRSDRTARRSC